MKHPLGEALAARGLTRNQVAEATGIARRTVWTDLSTTNAVSDRRLAAYAGLLSISLEEARELSPRPVATVASRMLRESGRTAKAVADDHALNPSALRCVLLGLRSAGPTVGRALESELGLPAEVLTQPDDGRL